MSAEHGSPSAARYSPAQARVLAEYADRGLVRAFTFGIGSNGYPAGDEAWLLLTDGRALWVAPDGSERSS